MLSLFKALDNLTEEVFLLNDEAVNYLLKENRMRVIYGAIKNLHISSAAPYFEDLVSEGTLLFMQAYTDYCQQHAAINERQLMGYAYRKIKWGLLDILRKEWKMEEHISLVNDDRENADDFVIDTSSMDIEEEVEFWELIREIVMICSPNGRKYLLKRLFLGYSVQEIADQEHVSRQTVNYWKNRIKQKSRKFFDFK